MILIKCEACGSNDLKRKGNMYECAYCGSKYLLDEKENVVEKNITETSVITMLQEANRLHEADKYGEELDLLSKAMEIDQDNATIYLKLGRCFRCLGQAERALEFYRKTLEIDPAMGTAYTNMGTIYTLRGDYAQAAEAYEKGLPMVDRAEFDYWVATANYAVSVAKLGNPNEAEKLISEAEAHGYKNGEAIRKMAGIKPKSFMSGIKSWFS